MNPYQQGLLDQCKQQHQTECVLQQKDSILVAVPFYGRSTDASPLLVTEDCKSKAKRVALDRLWWFKIVVVLTYVFVILYLSDQIQNEEIDPFFGVIQGSVILIVIGFWLVVASICLLVLYLILYMNFRSKWMKECVDAKGNIAIPEKSTAHKIVDFLSRKRR